MLIYLIDDEPSALEALRSAIENAVPKSEIRCFENAGKLFCALESETPDVLFTDIVMSEMNGVELAGKISEKLPKLNIVFVTEHKEYACEAFDLFASGYIVKPVSEAAITRQMTHLRYPVAAEKRVVAETFGNFSVLAGNTPVRFRCRKSLELLAYLIHSRGTPVSRRQLGEKLFEDESYSRATQKNLSKTIRELEEDLAKNGIKQIIQKDRNGIWVKPELISCDLYDFLNGRGKRFRGMYMEQYSWAEPRKYPLSEIQKEYDKKAKNELNKANADNRGN